MWHDPGSKYTGSRGSASQRARALRYGALRLWDMPGARSTGTPALDVRGYSGSAVGRFWSGGYAAGTSTNTVLECLGGAGGSVAWSVDETGNTTQAGKLTVNGINANLLSGNTAQVTSTFSKSSSTVLTAVTGLAITPNLSAHWFVFECWMFCTCGATAGGVKAAMTFPTLTAAMYNIDIYDGNTIAASLRNQTTSGASVGFTATTTTPTIHIYGAFEPSTITGNLQPQFAQNVSNATASTVAIGSMMYCF